jgi:hypothetical protein
MYDVRSIMKFAAFPESIDGNLEWKKRRPSSREIHTVSCETLTEAETSKLAAGRIKREKRPRIRTQEAGDLEFEVIL